jgi:hypothetical protein
MAATVLEIIDSSSKSSEEENATAHTMHIT